MEIKMLNQEDQLEIKILHKQGKGIRAITRELSKSRNTVRKYLRNENTLSYERKKKKVSILEPYKQYIEERLKNARPHHIPATVIQREIAMRGYKGGITTVRIYVRRLKVPDISPKIIRFETPPGQQMQVDWTIFQGGKQRLLAFIAILGYSRLAYVEFTTSDNEETLLQCHQNAFEYFNGVPNQILYDNMKTVVIERNGYQEGNHRFQKTFRDFAKHYGFMPKLCKPYRPQTKGKVERFIGYIKKSFYIPLITHPKIPQEVDIDYLNREVKKWLTTIANNRYIREIKSRPLIRKTLEINALQPLPPPYSIETRAIENKHNVSVEQRDLSIYEELEREVL